MTAEYEYPVNIHGIDFETKNTLVPHAWMLTTHILHASQTILNDAYIADERTFDQAQYLVDALFPALTHQWTKVKIFPYQEKRQAGSRITALTHSPHEKPLFVRITHIPIEQHDGWDITLGISHRKGQQPKKKIGHLSLTHTASYHPQTPSILKFNYVDITSTGRFNLSDTAILKDGHPKYPFIVRGISQSIKEIIEAKIQQY